VAELPLDFRAKPRNHRREEETKKKREKATRLIRVFIVDYVT